MTKSELIRAGPQELLTIALKIRSQGGLAAAGVTTPSMRISA